ncbi:DNA-binding response regulator [Vibrio toranzoniae]|uniref:DNA-binding response regulator n=1 Tax=Vibrio toranzoniae TaxID=1194427 RepID=UPI001378CCCF|nr:DNA-binding response regulator [Vibrio toranzoniae]NAZ48128.1 DNA-binding response regulator [Vibrio toranzoniae]
MTGDNQLIDEAEGLVNFRLKQSAEVILQHCLEHQNVVVNWQVGVGKSYNMDQVIEAAIRQGHYDLVIIMAPTRKIIDERKFIVNPPNDIEVINIRPRPVNLCGEERNKVWQSYEARNLSHLGKRHCCDLCPKRSECFWPSQYGKDLQGKQVVFATQTHLEHNPYFITHVKQQSNAEKVLVIFDEANVSLANYSRTITVSSIRQLMEATSKSDVSSKRKSVISHYLSCLLDAPSEDLQDANAWHFPRLDANDMTKILTIGDEIFGDSFHNIIYDLQSFGYSSAESREKLPSGDIRFPASPFTSTSDVLLYSGTTHLSILKMRLGIDFYSPYDNYEFKGEGTTWLNLASATGASSNFIKNSPQILDAFTQLTIQRIREGKRVLLVSKKSHAGYCVKAINLMLVEQGVNDIRVVHGEHYAENPDITLVPVIHYGVIGINQFEEFDCCYCLNSYYVKQGTLSDSVQDLRADSERIDVAITYSKNPRRRYGVVADDKYRFTDVAEVVNPMLQTLEMGCVIQAVGRVRPFTKTREVITFQGNDPLGTTYDKEFSNLAELRKHFGLATKRTRSSNSTADSVMALSTKNLKQAEIAKQLGISVRTVRRYQSKAAV